MREINNKLINILFGILCFVTLCMPLHAANGARDDNLAKYAPPAEQINPDLPKQSSNSISLSNSQFGFNWPLTVSTNFSQENGFSLAAQYVHKINEAFALAALFEYGPSTYRVGATAGFALDQKHLFKLSVEQLSQVLSFDFDSGTINQRLAQNAIGAQYQYSIDNKFIQSINLGAYYANTPSKELDPVIFESNGSNCKGAMPGVMCINFRNIAGGTSTGANAGAGVRITDSTLLNGNVYYDNVTYKTIYEESKFDRSGLGWSAEIAQLFGEKIKATAQVSMREIYDTYQGGIYWITPFLSQYGLELSLIGQHVISHNQTPNDTSIGLNFSMSFVNSNKYQLSSGGKAMDVGSWISTPAVHMAQVLAIKDQRTEVYSPSITAITPNSGSIAGGIPITIIGNRFYFPTAVTFGGVPATIISWTTDKIEVTLPPHAAGDVIVTVINKDNQTATGKFTYGAKSNSLATIKGMPHLTGRSVQGGHPSGGETVTIYGSDLGDENGLSEVIFVCGYDRYSDKQVSSTQIKIVKTGTEIQVITPRAKHECSSNIKRRFLYFKYNGIASDNDLEFDLYNPDHYKPLAILSGRSNKSCTMGTSNSTSCNGMWYKTDGFAGITIEKIEAQENGGKAKAENINVDGAKITFDVKNENDAEPAKGKYKVYFKNSDGRMITDDLTIYVTPKINKIHTNSLFADGTGSTLGGYETIINGENFANDNEVNFCGINVSPSDIKPTAITIKAPAHLFEQRCEVSVKNKQKESEKYYFTYIAPQITNIDKNSGSVRGGDKITINGDYFYNADFVKLGNKDKVPATYKDKNTITFDTPENIITEGDKKVDVVVSFANSKIIASKRNGFTYESAPKPQINSVSSIVENIFDDYELTINGESFWQPKADPQKKLFAYINDVKYEAVLKDEKTISLNIKRGKKANDQIKISVVNPDLQESNIKIFDFKKPQIKPDGVSPKQGAQGTEVTILGDYFGTTQNDTTITFDGKPAIISSWKNNEIKVIAPEPKEPAGTVNITITKQGHEFKDKPTFTYKNIAVINELRPNALSTAGGEITIVGKNFSKQTKVKFGEQEVTIVKLISSEELTVTAPANKVGTVNVTVINPNNEGITPTPKTFEYKKSEITSAHVVGKKMAGKHLNTAGGDEIEIKGQYFNFDQNVESIKVGGVAVEEIRSKDKNIIRVIAPAGNAGSADLWIKNKDDEANGSITEKGAFTYIAPKITRIYRPGDAKGNHGSTAGEYAVILEGQHYPKHAPKIEVDGKEVHAQHDYKNDIIHITMPRCNKKTCTANEKEKEVNVVFTNPDGKPITTTFIYEYPKTKSLSSYKGKSNGGDEVTIYGEYFYQVVAVKFGGTYAHIKNQTENSITVSTPRHIPQTSVMENANNTVSIEVVNADGNSATLSNAFTYTGYATTATTKATTINSPSSILTGGRHAKDSVYRAVIKEVVANHGSVGGGELVTIKGERLDQVTKVAFGSQETDKIVRIGKNSITVVAPSAPDGKAGVVNVMVGDANGKWFTKRKAYTYDADDLNIHSAANYNEVEEDNSVYEPQNNSVAYRINPDDDNMDDFDTVDG